MITSSKISDLVYKKLIKILVIFSKKQLMHTFRLFPNTLLHCVLYMHFPKWKGLEVGRKSSFNKCFADVMAF